MNQSTQAIVQKLIKQLELSPHPEGGYFKRTYLSRLEITFNKNIKPACSAIYYLLSAEDFSAWHKLKSDEIWFYHQGGNLLLHFIDADKKISTIKLGNCLNDNDCVLQFTVPANHWFCAEMEDKNNYCLVGCAVAPAFDYGEFELAEREVLMGIYPEHKKMITKFTRGD